MWGILVTSNCVRFGSLVGRPRRPGWIDATSAACTICESFIEVDGEVKSRRFEEDEEGFVEGGCGCDVGANAGMELEELGFNGCQHVAG